MLSVIVAAFDFIWQRWTKRREERKQISALYVNPFLLACEELQSRLYNILHLGGLGALRAESQQERSYAPETLYLIAQYFGWERHNFRYGPYAQDAEVFLRTEAIRATFATDSVQVPKGTPAEEGQGVSEDKAEPFRFFRYQQKALAQFILQTSQGPAGWQAETVPYLKFIKHHSTASASLPSVAATLAALEQVGSGKSVRLDPIVLGRLAEVQNHLVMLLAYLEKKEDFTLFAGVRKPATRIEDWEKWAERQPWYRVLDEQAQST